MKKITMQGGGSAFYTAPTVETLNISIERGFATSTGDLPITDWGSGEVDWWNSEE